MIFLFSSRRRHARCALVTGVQTCALSILHRHWPVGVAKGARRWVLEHLSEGGVSEAKARAALVLSEGARIVPMASVTGELHFQDVTAVYWDPLPPFLGVAGSATFTEDRFDLRVDRGRSGNIEARGGEMAFTNLSDGLDREFARSEEHTSELQSLM